MLVRPGDPVVRRGNAGAQDQVVIRELVPVGQRDDLGGRVDAVDVAVDEAGAVPVREPAERRPIVAMIPLS